MSNSNISSPLKLTSAAGTMEIYDPKTSITNDDYYSAQVIHSDPDSIWFVYPQENYLRDYYNWPDDACTIVQVQDNIVTTPKPIRSAQGFNKDTPGAILFEHSKFRGFGMMFNVGSANITDSFPQQDVQGASSLIVTGGVWNLFAGFNYSGTKIAINGQSDLGPGTYPIFSPSANDLARSLRQVRKE
jgi:hypothetical protein